MSDTDTKTSRTDVIRELTAYRLANEADVTGPDSPTSLGAEFLLRVAEAVAENLDYNPEVTAAEWAEDGAHEVADGCVPVYTHERWQTFVDLAAYTEDVSEYGGFEDDMTSAAGVALYMVADRLARQLSEMVDEAREDAADEDQ